MKVLVIDDDPRLREVLEVGIQLQWQDAQVLAAANGEAGLDRFFSKGPDVVLGDCHDATHEWLRSPASNPSGLGRPGDHVDRA